jgi:hypothetical protein
MIEKSIATEKVNEVLPEAFCIVKETANDSGE